MADTFDLGRFVAAQSPVIEQVKRELRSGEKRSHWMWFVFPQLAGLGSSPMAQRYAIASLDDPTWTLTFGKSFQVSSLQDCSRLLAPQITIGG